MKSPAEIVIERFGGPIKVATLLNLNISRIYRWTYSEERGGTGGLVPQKHQMKLLEAAKLEGIALEPADFFPRQAPEAAA